VITAIGAAKVEFVQSVPEENPNYNLKELVPIGSNNVAI